MAVRGGVDASARAGQWAKLSPAQLPWLRSRPWGLKSPTSGPGGDSNGHRDPRADCNPTVPPAPPTLLSVAFAPSTQSAGSRSLVLSYTVSSPSAQPALLGASIKETVNGGWLSDPSHDALVTVPAGVSTVTRTFYVPPWAKPTLYDVAWGLWNPARPSCMASLSRMEC